MVLNIINYTSQETIIRYNDYKDNFIPSVGDEITIVMDSYKDIRFGSVKTRGVWADGEGIRGFSIWVELVSN